MSIESFNVLTDAWIPLEERGKAHPASYLDLMTGQADAKDLVHPRDDVRFYVRVLLSALTQALFPPKDVKELQKRIEEPLSRKKASERIEEVKADFHLLGKRPFMQETLPSKGANETSRLFLDLPSGSRHLLFRSAHQYDGICPGCAIPALYGIQAFAPAGGSGLSPGVRGAPPLTTLVQIRSVRQTVWANVLSAARAGEYPPEGERPWNQKRMEKSGEAIGLLTGLFWQPRGVSLAPHGRGPCAACGAVEDLLFARAFKAKSKVAGGFFAHPFTPFEQMAKKVAGRSRRPVRLSSDRPAWTGLADMLPAIRGTESAVGTRPAPVVSQWFEDLEQREIRLLVFAYATAKSAKIMCRFNESLAVSMQKCPDLVNDIREMVEAAASCALALGSALRRAYAPMRNARNKSLAKQRKDGYWAADAASAFWQRTEAPFWTAVEQAEGNQASLSC